MATNLALDDNLFVKAKKIGGFKTKKEAVTFALVDFIKKTQQQKIVNLFGKINIDQSYNYKAYRNKK